LIDLSVLKYLIDSQGGINIMVKEDIFDPAFPGPNHSYETFQVRAGWRYFDGETALKYARTRHSPQGDFDRLERQQQVIEALKQKLAALDLVGELPQVLGILKELHSRVQTDIPWNDIPEYWQIFKKFSPEDMKNIVIEKENRLIVSAGISIEGQPVSALAPAAGPENYSEIQKFINDNL
jgi:anionic cell wall polymer biosynthesis LytR-Cps2A-Psr (LCP) family protein